MIELTPIIVICMMSVSITLLIFFNIPKHQKKKVVTISIQTFLISFTFFYVAYALTLDERTVMMQYVIQGKPDF